MPIGLGAILRADSLSAGLSSWRMLVRLQMGGGFHVTASDNGVMMLI